jgi:drug/metabolite transporter (DMT)-like permease
LPEEERLQKCNEYGERREGEQAQCLYVSSLRHISARMAGIVSCLEPIYSTLFAFLFLHETPALRDYIGAAIVLGAVVYSTLRANKAQEPAPKAET